MPGQHRELRRASRRIAVAVVEECTRRGVVDDVVVGIRRNRAEPKLLSLLRHSFYELMNRISEDKFISEAARKASQELHTRFMSYKPRNRPIPDYAVAALEVLDKLLEHELAATTPDTETPTNVPVVDKASADPA